jgi:uncharacterized protein (TIGR00730 family)
MLRPFFRSQRHASCLRLLRVEHHGVGNLCRGGALVYGGGNVGLMGAVADAVLSAGGEVVGVIPQVLVDMEVAHRGLTELRIVESMHHRKALMAELADAFIALPGGIGTLEELAEILTWAQLGLHSKPIALLNLDGYYDHLLRFIDHAVAERFVSPADRARLRVGLTVAEVLAF